MTSARVAIRAMSSYYSPGEKWSNKKSPHGALFFVRWLTVYLARRGIFCPRALYAAREAFSLPVTPLLSNIHRR